MVHAGLLPSWGPDEAETLARAAEAVLARRDGLERLAAGARRWRPDLEGEDRVAAAVRVFTRVRTVRPDGLPQLRFTGPPAAAPDGGRPWFEGSPVPRRGSRSSSGTGRSSASTAPAGWPASTAAASTAVG